MNHSKKCYMVTTYRINCTSCAVKPPDKLLLLCTSGYLQLPSAHKFISLSPVSDIPRYQAIRHTYYLKIITHLKANPFFLKIHKFSSSKPTSFLPKELKNHTAINLNTRRHYWPPVINALRCRISCALSTVEGMVDRNVTSIYMSREWQVLNYFYCQWRETDTYVVFLALTLGWSWPHPRNAFFSSLTTNGGFYTTGSHVGAYVGNILSKIYSTLSANQAVLSCLALL